MTEMNDFDAEKSGYTVCDGCGAITEWPYEYTTSERCECCGGWRESTGDDRGEAERRAEAAQRAHPDAVSRFEAWWAAREARVPQPLPYDPDLPF